MKKLNPVIFIFFLQVLLFSLGCGETGKLVYPSKASFYPTKKDKFIIYYYEEEVYAPGIGLISRKFRDIVTTWKI
jgi:hypothetical protein